MENPYILGYQHFFYISNRVLALNPREYPKMAGRIYPPWAEIEYGEITLDQLKNGEEVEFKFTVDYAMKSFNSEKDIEVRIYSFQEISCQLTTFL